MWGTIRAIGVFVAIPIALYFFFFIKRILNLFFPNIKNSLKYSIAAIGGTLIGVTSTDIFGFPAVFILHLMLFSLIARLINFIFKKALNGKIANKKAWQIIYQSGALALAVTLLFCGYGYYNLHNIVATEYTVTTQKNIREEGYRIILIADVHYGVSVNDEDLTAICKEIEGLSPDVVVLCGDIVDNNTTKTQMQYMFSAFGDINSKYGTFYVYGNHDIPFGFAGFESEFSKEELDKAISDNGIKLLCDDIIDINGELLIVGRDDISSKNRLSIDNLLQKANSDRFILTLDHQPRDYENIANSKTDLVLSGHTHGGQIWPVGFIQEVFNMNDEVYGHGYIDDDTQFIVTSGFAGWKYPVKTDEAAEYVVIDITKS